MVYPELMGPQPSSYDVCLSDISPEDLPGTISQVLRVGYLSRSDNIDDWPAKGRVYGIKRRVFFSIPVSIRDQPSSAVNVHFLFDTGAPATYLARSTVQTLGLEEWMLNDVTLLVNGRKVSTVLVSDSLRITAPDGTMGPCQFSGLNVLGMDYLDWEDAVLIVDMGSKDATPCFITCVKTRVGASSGIPFDTKNTMDMFSMGLNSG